MRSKNGCVQPVKLTVSSPVAPITIQARRGVRPASGDAVTALTAGASPTIAVNVGSVLAASTTARPPSELPTSPVAVPRTCRAHVPNGPVVSCSVRADERHIAREVVDVQDELLRRRTRRA